MTVSLGGLTLSDHLILTIGPAGVAHSQRRLIGGASVVQADGNIGGRSLVLQGEHHWTLGQIEQIRLLQAQALPVDLAHHRGSFTVLIIDTTDLMPSADYADPTDADWYSGTITMIEV